MSNDAGLNAKGQKGFANPWILARPVVTSPGVEPDPVAIPSGDEPVAIVLDFVDPCLLHHGLA
jgi:hypothetical protein